MAVPPAPQGDGLDVQGLRVAFGGLVAVEDLSFSVPFGRITGLIGPNGAGKTTTFDAISGLNPPHDGRVVFQGQDVTGVSAGPGVAGARSHLPAHGPVRPPDRPGERGSRPGGRFGRQQRSRANDRHPVAAPRDRGGRRSAMDLCGITDLADRQAGSLSTGQRRLVELARAWPAVRYPDARRALLRSGSLRNRALRRPSAAHRRRARFRHPARRARHVPGHEVCDYVYVLDFGRLLFEGVPAAVTASPEVQAAYLGYESLAAADAKGAV